MSLEGKTYKLGDVADVSWGDTNTTKSAYVSDGYPAYSASGRDGFLPYADFEKTGVVVSAIGANCGKTWLAKGQWSCIKNTIRMWSKSPLLDTEYLYWLSTRNNFFPIRGSAQPFISQGDARAVSINLPAISDQKAIAHILGALDDKIELNQRMNETLEDIAKAIFKSWFVDFDPVRAKAEGRPTGLPDEISDLFPDAFEDSEIGEIPAGWKVVPAESLFDITIGRTPPRKEPEWFTENGLDVPWVSIKDMGDAGTFIGSTSEYLTNAAVEKHRIALLPAGSVIVSFKLTVGRVSILSVDATTNEAIAHFPKNACFPFQAFAYFYLKSFNYDALGSTSSIATAVNSKMIKAMPFLKVNDLILEKFEALVAPILSRIEVAMAECRTLSELRDMLLPKLISGELRVPDAEKFLEEAGI